MQRHHLLSHQLTTLPCFARLLGAIGLARLGYDDFRKNGMLLPATEAAAARTGLPLHRGPHRLYNDLVVARFGQIEERWATLRVRAPEAALDEALMRLGLLQSALRRRLMRVAIRPFLLNRRDPLGRDQDFGHLDAMVDALWSGTA